MIKIFTTGMGLTIILALYCGACWYFLKHRETKKWQEIFLCVLIIISGSSAVYFGFYAQFEFIYPAHYGNIMYYNEGTSVTAEWFETEIMSTTPPELFYNLDRIILTRDMGKPRSFFTILRKDKRDVHGDYFPLTDSLRVKEMSVTRMKEIWTHELGHKFWYDRLNETQWAEWETLFNESNKYPTLYAKTSDEEDFAEHFMCIFTHHSCYTDEKKMQFFKEEILSQLQINFEIRPSKNGHFFVVEQLEFQNNQSDYKYHLQSAKALPLLS